MSGNRRITQMIPLDKIVNKFDVRVALDQDRVIQLAAAYQGEFAKQIPPIEVVELDEEQYAYVDGRTRAAARRYNNNTDIPAIVLNGNLKDNPLKLFARALGANWGGSKPPTQEDIVHTVLRMLELGASYKNICEELSFLPSGALRAYHTWARSVLLKRRLSRALDAVSEGMSVEESAKSFKVKLDHLKNVISGKKGKWGAARSQETQFAVEMKQYISRSLSSANSGIAMKLSFLFKKVEDGEISAKTAKDIVKNYREHLRKSVIRADDWMDRVDGITANQDKAIAAPEV